MRRSVVSVVVGFLAGALVVGLLEALGHRLYPPPAGIDLNDPEALKTIIKSLPRGALIMVLVAWTAGSLTGGFVAALIALRRKTVHALIVGGLQMLAGGVTMLMIPHPSWFVITSFLVVIPASSLGALAAYLLQQSGRPPGPQPYDMRDKNMAC
jgi:hypothetical protein